jgi:hypothetical protein
MELQIFPSYKHSYSYNYVFLPIMHPNSLCHKELPDHSYDKCREFRIQYKVIFIFKFEFLCKKIQKIGLLTQSRGYPPLRGEAEDQRKPGCSEGNSPLFIIEQWRLLLLRGTVDYTIYSVVQPFRH